MKNEVREFLTSRRAKVTPDQAGIYWGGADRRVPGLRRDEVAELAGVSIDYYTKLERGNIRGASDSVLGAIARALQLTGAEREHLFALARTAVSAPGPGQSPASIVMTVRPSVRRMLDGLQVPAIVYNARQDLLATNLLGRAMYSQHYESDRPNLARFTFLDPRARDFYADWESACCYMAAMLRLEVGRDPLNPDLTAFIGELSTLSPQFRLDWADQHVHEHHTGRKTFHHPEAGALNLDYDVFEFPGESGLWMTTYTAADEDSTSAKLSLLASWVTSIDSLPTAENPQHRME